MQRVNVYMWYFVVGVHSCASLFPLSWASSWKGRFQDVYSNSRHSLSTLYTNSERYRYIWASLQEYLSLMFAINKGADQPVHPHSLISALIACLLESILSKLAPIKISLFCLVSVAEESCLSLVLLETPKTGFVESRPISFTCNSSF